MFRNKRVSLGFTLIEVLVALAILASLSLSAYQVLSQVQQSNIVTKDKEAKLTAIQKAIAIMDSDFREIATRQFRQNGDAAGQQLLYTGDGFLYSDDQGILFARYGLVNPQMLFPRGEVIKVAYRIQQGNLERIWWRYPDTVSGDEGTKKTILTNVESLKFKFYYNGQWLTQWDKTGMLPTAIELKFKSKIFGEIEHVYLVASTKLSLSNATK